MSISWENLDNLESYKKLQALKGAVNIAAELSGPAGAKRVAECSVPMGAGLTYNYAAKQVNEKVLKVLSELAEELYDEGFAIPHSSYLVNLRKIISVSGDSLVMENESIISISRACKEKFHHEFSKYFNKKYRRGQ